MMEDLLNQYLELFGDSFPMYQLGRGKTEEEVAEIVKKCIDAGKDAYALGLCMIDEDVLY